MSKRKKLLIRLLAIVIAIAMPLATALVSFADSSSGTASTASKYASPDINVITGHGAEPEELSVSAAATYQEKAWYEYITYSDKAVCSYRLNDDSRLLFYDPYTYTNAMVMDVQFDATTTEFDTMSEYTVSSTNSKTIDTCISSIYSDTEAVQTSGKDYSGSKIANGGTTITNYNHSIENPKFGTVTETTKREYSEYRYKTSSDQYSTSVQGGGGAKGSNLLNAALNLATGNVAGALAGALGGIEIKADSSETHSHTDTDNASIQLDKETKKTTYSDDYKTSTDYKGSDTVEYNTNSSTEGWEQLSARVTKTIGSSNSTSNSWSETDSTTVTRTYAATHFASDGVTPLPWAIVHYSVQMPMKCCLQYKVGGEWVTISTVYCLLTTVKGTCRTWMQNGQAYYEDWGNGEPVTAVDFWSQFMTKDQLMNAYTQKLYPVGGED